MLATNPFSPISEFWSPLVLQVYIVLMLLAVFIGTLFDVYHKGSAKFFARRRRESAARAERQLSGGETF